MQAVELIRECNPDVVVLDIIMPQLDGIGVLENFVGANSSKKRPKFIMLTAFGQENVTRRSVELGADYFMLKPLDFNHLVDRIRELASEASLHQYVQKVKARDPDVDVTNIMHEMGIPAHEFLKNFEENSLAKEFLSFLRGENMAKERFNFQDVIAMSTINSPIKKVDECLDSVRPEFKKIFGKPNQYDLKQIREYGRFCIKKDKIFS